MKRPLTFRTTGTLLAASLLAGCATDLKLPSAAQADQDAQIKAADAWVMPLPHGGSTVQLLNWWTQTGDPTLTELMQAAQSNSASLAAALTRIAQARTGVAQAQQANGLNATLSASANRGVQQPKASASTSATVGVQASWEIDLWGGKQASTKAALLRQRQAELGWHEARVAVAAETASSYFNYRYCESLGELLQLDANSRAETARLESLTAQAGFSAPAIAQLARASSLDAASNVTATRAQCDAQFFALVALSGLPQADLRRKLMVSRPLAQNFSEKNALFSVAGSVPSVPAKLLAQRPDIADAQIGVTAASLDIRSADSGRFPSLSLSGNIGRTNASQMGVSREGLTWGIGPIAVSLPLTNQAITRSSTEAAIAAYQEAVVRLNATARQAVREVEESLASLQAAKSRGELSQAAVAGYNASLAATQARYRAGLASLTELEDARRTALFAQQSQLAVERDRIAAWIALYRAAGGGWTPEATVASAASRSQP